MKDTMDIRDWMYTQSDDAVVNHIHHLTALLERCRKVVEDCAKAFKEKDQDGCTSWVLPKGKWTKDKAQALLAELEEAGIGGSDG